MLPILLESTLLFGFTRSLCFGGAWGVGIISSVIDEFLFLLSRWKGRVFSFDALEGVTEPIFSCWKWGIWRNFWSLWCGAATSLVLGAVQVCSHMVLSNLWGSGIKMAVAGIVQECISGKERLLLYYQAKLFFFFYFPNVSVSTNTGQIFIQYLRSASVHQKVKSGGDFCR